MKALPISSARLGELTRLAAIGLLLCFGGCSRKTATAPVKTSDQPTEQRWIISAIVKDSANMAVFAARPDRWLALPAEAVDVRASASGEPGRNYTLALRLPDQDDPVRSDLQITGSVWSPELYVPMLRTVLARSKVAPPTGDRPDGTLADADFLKALSNPVTSEIEAENQRLSGWLQTHPCDARGHEQAALLLGTLALRENSGWFWNPRGLCNRAAAHLAFARALQPEVSTCGEVAELLIGLIVDTKADCQKRIAALQARVAAEPELGPWVNATGLRNTRDYRLLPNPSGATFLERVELFRAMSESIGSEQAIKRLGDYQAETAPDWSRIVLQGGFGVGAGHVYALPSFGLEMDDASGVFPGLQTARTAAQFEAVLNLLPGDAVQAGEGHTGRLRVIDPGTWAQFFQRHLLQSADETYYFLQNLWGVPAEAKDFRSHPARASFSKAFP